MAVGKSGGRRVRVGVEHGYAVAHGFSGNSKHTAELAAAEYTEHGGGEDGDWVHIAYLFNMFYEAEFAEAAFRRP